MIVERVEELGRGRQRIWLDDGAVFSLYPKEASAFGQALAPGVCLEQEQFQELLQQVLIPRAKRRAMHLLERMERTEAQLREKLTGDYPQEAVEAAVEYVKSYHYVDDLRYACNYVRCRCKEKSRLCLRMELYQRGVSKALVEQALEEEYGEEDEKEKIVRWLEKKHYEAGQADVKQKQRMYQFLLRKGFRAEDVLRVL